MGKADIDARTIGGPFLFHVGKGDDEKFAVPHAYADHSTGLEQYVLVDRSAGSVHMGAGICRLAPAGCTSSRVHAYEKGIYLLSGELEVQRDAEAFRLTADDYAFVPYGTPHALRNTSNEPARWFEMSAPQPKPPGGWEDTLFLGAADWPAQVGRPDLEDPCTRFLGRFKGQKPMIRDAAGVRGLKVHRFMERDFGVQHFFMMRGELAVGGVRGRHDHAVEEIYYVIEGEADIEMEGTRYPIGPGDYAWTGVGTCHAFFQKGE